MMLRKEYEIMKRKFKRSRDMHTSSVQYLNVKKRDCAMVWLIDEAKRCHCFSGAGPKLFREVSAVQ